MNLAFLAPEFLPNWGGAGYQSSFHNSIVMGGGANTFNPEFYEISKVISCMTKDDETNVGIKYTF